MLKSMFLIALITLSASFAYGDDRADGTSNGTSGPNDTNSADQPAPPRKDVYQKLGITSGDPSEGGQAGDREPAAAQPEQQPQQREDTGNTTQPRDTSDQPLNSNALSQ